LPAESSSGLLPDFFHYEGQPPNIKKNGDGSIIRFSTPVKVWVDNEDNYAHLYYRSDEHVFHCAVSGCVFSNSPADHRNGNIIKHIHNKHPEYCAYEDLPDWYKTRKEDEWQSTTVVADTVKLQTSGKVSSFYTPVSLDEAHKDNLLESISLGFWSLNFGSSHAGKHLLSHWGKGKVFSGAGRTAMTLHAKNRHKTIIEKKSVSFAAIKKVKKDRTRLITMHSTGFTRLCKIFGLMLQVMHFLDSSILSWTLKMMSGRLFLMFWDAHHSQKIILPVIIWVKFVRLLQSTVYRRKIV
jgi:hypothetical protein